MHIEHMHLYAVVRRLHFVTRACSHGRLGLAVGRGPRLCCWVGMDFVSVPAGTLDAAAFALRGADHDVDMLANDSYVAVQGNASLARNHAGGRNRICLSNTSGPSRVTCSFATHL
jgi:hypothetical protein